MIIDGECEYGVPRFHGGCVGVDVSPRGKDDPHIMIVLCVEDDETWHRQLSVSSAWLEELIAVLYEAHRFCLSQEADMDNDRQYGWKFRKVE